MANLEPLADFLAQVLNRSGAWARGLSSDALAVTPITLRSHPGGSRLNADGSPLEVCLSFGGRRNRVRLIADPGAHLDDAGARFRVGRKALRHCIDAIGSNFGSRCEALILAVSTHGDGEASGRPRFWMALGLDDGGLALYVDGLDDEHAPWDLSRRAARSLLTDARAALSIIDLVEAKGAMPASIGIEGTGTGGRDRFKLYFKLMRPLPLEELDELGFADPAMKSFLARIASGYPLRPSSLVFSCGFDLDRGVLCDSKVDVCGHCVPRSSQAWVDLLATWVETRDDDRLWPGLRTALVDGGLEVAFVGFGCDDRDRARLNVYLKSPTNIAEQLRQAVRRAGEALLSRQDSRGHWSDFALPVGESTEWVTAVSCLALHRASIMWELPELARGSSRAATWLETNRAYVAGWGFNATTGPDADSTAFAIRALRSNGRPVAAVDAAFLEALWHADGGFRTYDRDDGWGWLHPCVTPQAFLALSPEAQRRRLAPLLRTIERSCDADGTWPAYWWAKRFYSTYLSRSMLREMGLVANRRCTFSFDISTLSDFDLANAIGLAAEGAFTSAPSAETLLGELLKRQRHDGGWTGGTKLRVTEPGCRRPYTSPEGTVYSDARGIFTTAWVLYVLSDQMIAGRDWNHSQLARAG